MIRTSFARPARLFVTHMSSWIREYDPSSRRFYFHHALTKETSWEVPKEGFTPGWKIAERAWLTKEATSVAKQAGNADDWVPLNDPSTGKTYYFSKKLNKTSWTNPETVPSSSSSS